MAVKEGAGQPQSFVKEIDYNEIEKLEVCLYSYCFEGQGELSLFSFLYHEVFCL